MGMPMPKGAPPRAVRARSCRRRRNLQPVPHLARQDDGALDRDENAPTPWRVDLDPVLVLEVVDAEHRHDGALA